MKQLLLSARAVWDFLTHLNSFYVLAKIENGGLRHPVYVIKLSAKYAKIKQHILPQDLCVQEIQKE